MAKRGHRDSDEHREFEDMAVAHVVGGLSLDQGRVFRSHLLECTSCRARVGELRAIAHDLADVERDERRLRTAKRTETKARESEDGDAVPAASPRLSGRAVLVVAAGLTILMALSAWNFVLRGRLQQTEQTMTLLRESVGVLQDGDTWEVTPNSRAPGVDGQVSTLGQEMAIMVDGLAARDYGIYVLSADGETLHRTLTEATNGMLYEYVVNHAAVQSADRVLLIRTDDLPPTPDETAVFEAKRPEILDDLDIESQPVVEPVD